MGRAFMNIMHRHSHIGISYWRVKMSSIWASTMSSNDVFKQAHKSSGRCGSRVSFANCQLTPNRKLGPEIKDIQMTISTSFKMKLELEYDKYRKDVRKENGWKNQTSKRAIGTMFPSNGYGTPSKKKYGIIWEPLKLKKKKLGLFLILGP